MVLKIPTYKNELYTCPGTEKLGICGDEIIEVFAEKSLRRLQLADKNSLNYPLYNIENIVLQTQNIYTLYNMHQ